MVGNNNEAEELKLHLFQLKSSTATLCLMINDLLYTTDENGKSFGVEPLYVEFQKTVYFFMRYVDLKIKHCLSDLHVDDGDVTQSLVIMNEEFCAEIESGYDYTDLSNLDYVVSQFVSHKSVFQLKCRCTKSLNRTTVDVLNTGISSMVASIDVIDEFRRYISVIQYGSIESS